MALRSPSARPGRFPVSTTTFALRGGPRHRATRQSCADRRLRPLRATRARDTARSEGSTELAEGSDPDAAPAADPACARHRIPTKGVIMRLGTSIVLIALGAILT